MVEKVGVIAGIEQRYWHCNKCGREVVDMEQLHEAAIKERAARRRSAKIAKWGAAVAVRIPKEIVQIQKIKVGEEAIFEPSRAGFKVSLRRTIPQRSKQ